VSIDAVEQAAYDLVQAQLPAELVIENAAHGDGIAVPAVAFWQRGLPRNARRPDPADYPHVAIGTYTDRPVADASAGSGLSAAETGPYAGAGSLLERPILVTLLMPGDSDQEAHIRLVRALDALKRVLRRLEPSDLDETVIHWPFDLEAEWEPPSQLAGAGIWISLGTLEVARCRVFEGPDE
jgi:hypothetical protein